MTCVQGRSLCWPNILQHKVDSFTLTDPTTPGIRKILVFFLIDPNKRITSTTTVPPQQQEWMEGEWERLHIFSFFPIEVRQLILQYIWHFPHTKALYVRDQMMSERKYFTQQNTQEVFLREFSLCEH